MDRPSGDDRQFATPQCYHCTVCDKPQHLLVQRPWWVCPECKTRFVPADIKPVPENANASPRSGHDEPKPSSLLQ
jgi:hypothetical protein